MCVIIYVPQTATISKSELKDAWTVNPHGAGFSVQENERVYFKRGFMDFDDYYDAIKEYIGVKNLLLHFRISTSKEVNKIQTHPYKKGNVTITEGYTTKPVICMNGIISGQKEYEGCNDTMSYIVDHEQAFANINQDILDIIEEASGAKWAVMKPDEVLLSSKFTENEGRYYSNKNHLFTYYTYYKRGNTRKKNTLKSLIKNKKLRKRIKSNINKELYYDLLDFIDLWCNHPEETCDYCTKCLKTANTLRDIKIILNENYYYEPEYEILEEKESDTKDCLCYCEPDLYDDPYNYNEDEYIYNQLGEYFYE